MVGKILAQRRTALGYGLGAAVALLVAFAGCGGPAATSAGPEGTPPETQAHVVVRVEPAEMRKLAQTVSALGRCEALPEKLALLTPALEGQVAKILVQQGQQVAAGQPIVQFDLALAAADLAEKEAARDSLAATLTLLQSLPRDKEQEASKLAVEHAKIAVTRGEALVQRLLPLRMRNEVSEQQVFEAEQALAQARVQERSAAAQLDVLLLGPRAEAVAEAQSKIKVAEQAIALSKVRLELHTIRAPLAGVLDSLTCRPGQTIPAGTSVGMVVDAGQVLATAWLPVASGQRVRVGQSARVRIATSTPAAGAHAEKPPEISGQVVFRGQVADAQTGNLRVQVLLDNPQGELIIGQTVEVAIQAAQPAELLAVPVAALHDEGEGQAITVVRDGKAVVLHPETGISDAGWVAAIGTDLKPGESVIVAGAYNLPAGTAVQVEAAEQGHTP